MKKVLLLLLVVVSASCVKAEVNALTIEKKDGSTESYHFEHNPVITFNGPEMTVTANNITTTYDMADIHRYHVIEDSATGIDLPGTASDMNIDCIGGDIYIISGTGIKSVRLYDVSGVLRKSYTGSSPISVSLTGYDAGVYLLSVEKATGVQTIKIAKR